MTKLAKEVAIGDDITIKIKGKSDGGEVVALSNKDGKVTFWLRRVGNRLPVLRDIDENAEVLID